MTAHWTTRFIGDAYTADYQCADLVNRVRREVWGHALALPTPASTRDRTRTVLRLRPTLADLTDTPQDGDAVVMRAGGRRRQVGHHLGLYVSIDGGDWVLHCLQGCGSILTPVRRLCALNLELEGYYRWR